MTTYTTIQGDMWDLIAYKVYGQEAAMTILLEANKELKDIAVFPQGVKIVCPDYDAKAASILPPWKR